MLDLNIEDANSRNSVIVSFLVSPHYKEEDRIEFLKAMLDTGLFGEYEAVYSDGNFFSAEYLRQINFPFSISDIGLPIEDVRLYFRKEEEHRKKRQMLQSVIASMSESDTKSIEVVKSEIITTVSQYAGAREKYKCDPVDTYKHYKLKKEGPLGVLTGIEGFDRVIQGLEYGTVSMIFGFVGQGKTTVCLNILYEAITRGFNVVFFNLEVSKMLMQYSLLSIHSYVISEKTCKEPVPFSNLLKGNLTEEEEKYVFGDLEKSLNALPGKFVFLEQDDIGDFSYSALDAFCNDLPFKVDVVFIDYVQLLLLYMSSFTKFQAKRSFGENVRYAEGRFIHDFTRLAIGRGGDSQKIIIFSAQANREGYKKATENDGVYDLTAISDISQLEKDASYVFSLYIDEGLRRSGEVKVCLLKNKTGEVILQPLIVPVNPKFYVVGDKVVRKGNIGFSEIEEMAEEFDLSGLMGSG